MTVVDPSEINGFDATKHIGFEFDCKDKCEVPSKTKVIEVDEDTGKEALISRNQKEDEDYLWTFSKILDHRAVANGEIEVEVLRDNGETSWEPLAVLHKDDPVALVGYAKERRLLEQHGWKWAENIARCKKNFVRIPNLMKSSKKYQKTSYRKKTYKVGVHVLRTGDDRGAMKLDKENGTNLWFDTKKEASTLRNMDTFELMPENFDLT
eukprot:6957899-Ditylum_brightwellii.AAC.1